MPRRDGTGPTGKGARTGRGLGSCKPRSKPAKRVLRKRLVRRKR